MKIKMIYANSYHEGEDRVNDWLKSKKNINIIDIKFTANYVSDEDHYMFMLMYD